MRIIPFHPDHVAVLDLQPSQAHIDLPGYLEALKDAGIALTAVDQGRVVACGGIVITEGKGILWGYISADCKRSFVMLDRIVRRLLLNCKLPRVEATVEPHFSNGCRWLSLLGFRFDKPLFGYGPSGEDHVQYVWGN